MVTYFRLLFIISVVASSASAAPKVKDVPYDPLRNVFVGSSTKFNKTNVYCLKDGSKLKAGFLRVIKRKKYWSDISSWIKTQRVSSAQIAIWKKQLKTAQKACDQLPKTCRPAVSDANITVNENTSTPIVLNKTAPCKLSTTIVRITDPSHGSIEATADSLNYTPDKHSLSDDSMSIAVANAISQSNTATIHFQIQKVREQFAGDPNSLLPYREELTADENLAVLKKIGLGGSPELRAIRNTSRLADAILNDTETETAIREFNDYDNTRLRRSANLSLPDPRWFDYDIENTNAIYLRNGRPGRTWMSYIFWANHIAVNVLGWSNSDHHYAMVDHFKTLRQSSFGNFRGLLFDLFHQVPFHEYLNNFTNTIRSPSQNFPREFLELFTAGVKDPITQEMNYTEDDVVAATRYLSGWGYNSAIYGYRGNLSNVVPVAQQVRASDDDPYYYPGNATCVLQTANKINVTWTPFTGAYRLAVYRSIHGANSFTQVSGILNPSSSSYIDAADCGGASPPLRGVLYDYKIASLNSSLAVVGASAPDTGYFGTPPTIIAAPTGLTVSNGTYSNKVTIQWNPSSGAKGYRIYKISYDGLRYDTPLGADLPSSQYSFEDYGVIPNQVYMYYVRAIANDDSLSQRNGHGSDEIDVLYGYARQLEANLDAVRHIVVSNGTSSSAININWDRVSGAEGYRIYRTNDFTRTLAFLADLQSSATSYADTSTVPGSNYGYTIIAYDSSGLLGPSTKGARFNYSNWATNQNTLQPMPFLAWMPNDNRNAGGRILGTTVNNAPQGEALSAFGEGYPGQQVGSFVDHVLNNWPATSRNIGAKLFAQIVHRQINEALVNEVAHDLLANNYNIKPVLRKLITSSAMFAPEAVGTCVSNPTEVMISFLRLADLPVRNSNTRDTLISAMTAAGHTISAPPSIFGFPDCGLVRGGSVQDGSNWILSSQTYISVGNGISSLLKRINDSSGSGGEGFDIVNYFSPTSITTSNQLVDRVTDIFGVKMTPEQKQILVSYLNKDQNGNLSPWNRTQRDRLSGLIRLVIMSVEFLNK